MRFKALLIAAVTCVALVVGIPQQASAAVNLSKNAYCTTYDGDAKATYSHRLTVWYTDYGTYLKATKVQITTSGRYDTLRAVKVKLRQVPGIGSTTTLSGTSIWGIDRSYSYTGPTQYLRWTPSARTSRIFSFPSTVTIDIPLYTDDYCNMTVTFST